MKTHLKSWLECCHLRKIFLLNRLIFSYVFCCNLSNVKCCYDATFLELYCLNEDFQKNISSLMKRKIQITKNIFIHKELKKIREKQCDPIFFNLTVHFNSLKKITETIFYPEISIEKSLCSKLHCGYGTIHHSELKKLSSLAWASAILIFNRFLLYVIEYIQDKIIGFIKISPSDERFKIYHKIFFANFLKKL